MSSDLARLLVDLARAAGAPVDYPRSLHGHVPRVQRALTAHGLLSTAAASLGDDVPGALRTALDQHSRAAAARDAAACLQLGLVAHAMDRAGIPWAAVKGPVLAHSMYPPGALRDYADLDLLVGRKHFVESLELLQSRGATVIEQDWREVLQLFKGELNLRAQLTVIDLHWSLLYDHALRSSFAWDDAQHLSRRVVVDLGSGLVVPTLDAASTLLHLCVHAALAGGQKLSWMLDVAYASEQPTLDWDLFERESHQQGVALCTGVMLRRVRTTLGLGSWSSQLERSLTTESRWASAIRCMDVLHPASRWSGGSLSGHLVMASTRRDTGSSLRELRNRIATEIGVIRADEGHPWAGLVPRALKARLDQSVAHTPEPYRTAYLEAVRS